MGPNRAFAASAVAGIACLLVACTRSREMSGPTAPGAAVISGSYEPPPPRAEAQVGFATWYGEALAGRRTASGEPFNPLALTAAHRTLPFGTWVEVTRVDTGASVRVRITDRGPYGHRDRIIDLARGAAERIDLVKTGVTRVTLRIVDTP
jgi:rare lipoprotein A